MLKEYPSFAPSIHPDQMTAHFMTNVDLDRVFAIAQEALRRNPNHIPAYDALGSAYFQRGDVEATLRVLAALIRLDPQNPAYRFKKALLCQHQGEIALAVEEFIAVCEIDSEGPYALPARESLHTLDMFQLQQIFVLTMDDTMFRTQVLRDPQNAVEERGFLLSPFGNQMLNGFLL
ncbi:MAG: Tetratricopeptide repeat protein, partial [Chthonomonadaceae bacterium]|nr:Tetratricopeptide repeat protein [Chthonomonadaceae bacterium]